MKDLKAKTFKYEPFINGNNEICNINYDMQILNINIKFFDPELFVTVIFDGVDGYRVLDEGDLLEYWTPSIRPNGWIWEIEEGGWRELESQRVGFLHMGRDWTREYFILGDNECINVLSVTPPKIVQHSKG